MGPLTFVLPLHRGWPVSRSRIAPS